MEKYPFKMCDFMRIVKSSKYVPFMEMCSRYYNDAKKDYDLGESRYEIRGFHTKSGNPWIVFQR